LIDAQVGFRGEAVMVCTSLPTLLEFRTLYSTDIREVHFIGDLDKPESVNFLNDLSKASPKNGFKIVQLGMPKKDQNQV